MAELKTRDAHLYQSTETRFPKAFPSQQLNIGQRYFIDKQNFYCTLCCFDNSKINMTGNRPQRPQPPSKPNRPSGGGSSPELAPKPYEFVSFPQEKPNLQRPVGHHKYLSDRLHGTLYLTLKVQTSLHVSTGVSCHG